VDKAEWWGVDFRDASHLRPSTDKIIALKALLIIGWKMILLKTASSRGGYHYGFGNRVGKVERSP